MKTPLLALLSAALAALCGCSRTALVEKMAPQDVQQASLKAVSDLRARHFDALNQTLVDSLRNQDHAADFNAMASFFPDEQPKAVNPVGYYFNTGTSGSRYDITYEYEFSHLWVLVQFSWVRADGNLRILNFHVNSSRDSLAQRNAFTFKGTGPVHYVVLLLGTVALAVSLTSLVACIRTKNLKRRWLWIIFIIFGIGAFSVNWTTGAYQIAFLRVQLLSFSAFAPAGEPWTVAVSVPVGAVVFLERLRRRRSARDAALTSDPPPLP
jgi:hypothetical protein